MSYAPIWPSIVTALRKKTNSHLIEWLRILIVWPWSSVQESARSESAGSCGQVWQKKYSYRTLSRVLLGRTTRRVVGLSLTWSFKFALVWRKYNLKPFRTLDQVDWVDWTWWWRWMMIYDELMSWRGEARQGVLEIVKLRLKWGLAFPVLGKM